MMVLSVATFTGVNKKHKTKYGGVILAGIFTYVSYLMWGENALIIPLLLVLYFILNYFLNKNKEQLNLPY